MLMSGLAFLGGQAAGLVRRGRARRQLPPRPACTGRSLCSAAARVELPAWLSREDLLTRSRQQFVALQAAWDRGDMAALAALTTPQMLDELGKQLQARGQAPNRTDVLTLHADLLGFDTLGEAWLLSLEFSGMIRESTDQGARPFRELWLMTQERSDQAEAQAPSTGQAAPTWRLARQQALI